MAELEGAFKHAVSKLPDYKRAAAWAYVNDLKKQIEQRDKQIDELSTEIARKDG